MELFFWPIDLYVEHNKVDTPLRGIVIKSLKMNWYWILGWIPSIFAIFGNSFIIYLICTSRKLRTVPNCFILSLA